MPCGRRLVFVLVALSAGLPMSRSVPSIDDYFSTTHFARSSSYLQTSTSSRTLASSLGQGLGSWSSSSGSCETSHCFLVGAKTLWTPEQTSSRLVTRTSSTVVVAQCCATSFMVADYYRRESWNGNSRFPAFRERVDTTGIMQKVEGQDCLEETHS